MPNYTFICDVCESATEEHFRFADRPDTIQCACGGTAQHTITPVGLMVKEAYLDGTRRKGWADMREASKLNKEMGKQKDDKGRKEIANQIRKLGVDIQEKK
jgi:predicted nucleic acid-binding Zn ribbon protein